MSDRYSYLEPGFQCNCMFLYKLFTLLKLCKYSFYDLTIVNSHTFPCMFAYFGLLGSIFMHNAYYEDFLDYWHNLYLDLSIAYWRPRGATG